MAKVGPKFKFNVTPEIIKEVEILSGRGLTQEQTYQYYGISKDCWYDSVKRHPDLGVAFKKGKAKTISLVSGRLMKLIEQNNLSAIIFYLKTQGRWSEQLVFDEDDGTCSKPAFPAITLTVNDPIEAAKIYQQIMIGS